MFQEAIQSELKALGLINPPAKQAGTIATMGDLFSFSSSDEFYPSDAEALALAYENLVTMYRAIDIRASSFAALPLKIIQKKDNEEIDVSDKDQLFVLNSPNAFDSFYSFYYESVSLLDIQGELFWNFERDDSGNINQLFSDWRSHEIKVKGDPVTLINHYERTSNGKVTKHSPEDVFFVKCFNYFSILRGFSRMVPSRANIITSLNSQKFLKKFFAQGMFPGAVAETEGKLTEPEFARLREQMQSIYGSVENMHKVALLEGGLKLNVLQKSSLSENQIIPLLDFDDQKIATLYGVPMELLNDPRGSSSLSREAIKAAESVFWTNTMLPLSRQILSEINKNLLPQLTSLDNVEVQHDFSRVLALREDAQKRDERYFKGVSLGIISRDEARPVIFELDPTGLEEMEEFTAPINLVPVGEGVTPQEQQRGFIDKDFHDRSKAWMKNARLFNKYEPVFNSAITKFFNEQEIRVLERWRRATDLFKSKKQTTLTKDHEFSSIAFDAPNENMLIVEALLPPTTAAVSDGAASILSALGLEFNAIDPFVISSVGERVINFSEINGTTARQIQETLREGIAAGEGIPQLTDRIQGVFTNATRSRSQLIARTESVGSVNSGILTGGKQGGFTTKVWLTSRDLAVRDSHKIDGQRIFINENFRVLSGYTGLSTAYPSDFNERCSVLMSNKEPNI